MKIKQLIWTARKIDCVYVAPAFSCAYYQVQRVDRLEEPKDLWEATISVDGGVWIYFTIGEHPTIEEAKAAAQADFEQRVMACFETTDKSNFWG